ncbi:hypothetical protein N9U47_00570 [Candidatus Pelagibacter sp.]|nr:hypothetical protein [Candidatus Pelagibacter sp.]
MIKKTIFFIFILIFTFACGKKSDPEYKEKTTKIINTKISMVS